MSRLYDGSIITVDGMNFKVSLTHDCDMGHPWEECDGHGPVSDWERRNKAAGEMILCTDRGSKRFYDFQEAVKIARRDRWGTTGEFRTAGEQAHAAAMADFEYLRRWCADQWEYVILGVSLLDEDDDEMGETEYLGGVEYDPSSDTSYVLQEAESLAAQIIHRVGNLFADTIEPHEEISSEQEHALPATYVSI